MNFQILLLKINHVLIQIPIIHCQRILLIIIKRSQLKYRVGSMTLKTKNKKIKSKKNIGNLLDIIFTQ